jgi:hypothetical protein
MSGKLKLERKACERQSCALFGQVHARCKAHANGPRPCMIDGEPCGRGSVGLLRRRPVVAGAISLIGKESNKRASAGSALMEGRPGHSPYETQTKARTLVRGRGNSVHAGRSRSRPKRPSVPAARPPKRLSNLRGEMAMGHPSALGSAVRGVVRGVQGHLALERGNTGRYWAGVVVALDGESKSEGLF